MITELTSRSRATPWPLPRRWKSHGGWAGVCAEGGVRGGGTEPEGTRAAGGQCSEPAMEEEGDRRGCAQRAVRLALRVISQRPGWALPGRLVDQQLLRYLGKALKIDP